jgi:hypothetical protein
MTKFILHGGNAQKRTSMNSKFYKEMALAIPAGGHYLGVYWARAEKTWFEHFKFDRDRLKKTGKLAENISYEIATPEEFAKQVAKADVIYFRDGIPADLKTMFDRTGVNAEEALKGKSLVVGDAAGAMLLGLGGYYPFADEKVFAGLGVIKSKVMAHSNVPDFVAGMDELTKLGDADAPIISIAETEFVVIEE